MPISKSRGNMYDWVTHTWSVLQGECPHGCKYCYVKNGHWTKNNPAYQGSPRLEPDFDKVKLGRGRTIFVAHTSDLFAEGVPIDTIFAVLSKCAEYPDNNYVFQTKNPGRMSWFADIPEKSTLGTTIETNSAIIIDLHSKAPTPMSRAIAMRSLGASGFETFVTIEPIMIFGLPQMLELIRIANPSWVNVGADSKGCGLPEPSMELVHRLLDGIHGMGIEIREKTNLQRLCREGGD